jgi:hypothetical protein
MRAGARKQAGHSGTEAGTTDDTPLTRTRTLPRVCCLTFRRSTIGSGAANVGLQTQRCRWSIVRRHARPSNYPMWHGRPVFGPLRYWSDPSDTEYRRSGLNPRGILLASVVQRPERHYMAPDYLFRAGPPCARRARVVPGSRPPVRFNPHWRNWSEHAEGSA